MSDTCFLCLTNTRIKQCVRCNLRSHHKCWKKYLDSVNIEETAKCPQCSAKVRTKPVTRLRTRMTEKKEIIAHVKNLLTKLDLTFGRLQKEIVATEIFDYLLLHINFVYTNKKFEVTVRQKLKEMYFEDHWEPGKDFYFRMFKTSISQE